MKFTRKNILSFVLSLVMMFSVFAGVAPVKASAAEPEAVYSFSYAYDCKRVPDFAMAGSTIVLNGFGKPYKNNKPNPVDSTMEIAGDWKLTYKGKYDETKHAEVIGTSLVKITKYIEQESGLNINRTSLNIYELSNGGNHVTLGILVNVFEDGVLFIAPTRGFNNGTGYYLTNNPVNSDSISRTVFGDLFALTTNDITFDRTKYTSSDVKIETFVNGNSTALASTNVNNSSIMMPENGTVKVTADSKFEVSVTTSGATPSVGTVTKVNDEYICEITGITADATVAVTKLVDITLNETNYPDAPVGLTAGTATGDTITVPEYTEVRVSAPDKFAVEVNKPVIVSDRAGSDTAGYYYDITNITEDTTVKVTSIYDITFNKDYYVNGDAEIFVFDSNDVYVNSFDTNTTFEMLNGNKVAVITEGKFEAVVNNGTPYVVDADANGEYKLEITGITEDKTVAVTSLYDMTLDRTEYAYGYVELFTYYSNNEVKASTETNGATVVMPEGGKVEIIAADDFVVTINDTTYASQIIEGTDDYRFVISNITADTTFEVEKVPHTHLWGYNTQYDAAAHWDHCHVCGAKSSYVAHSDEDGDGYCVCGWHIESTTNTTENTTDTTVNTQEENRKDEVPNTGHNDITWVAFLAMVLSGCGLVLCSKKRNAFNKEN